MTRHKSEIELLDWKRKLSQIPTSNIIAMAMNEINTWNYCLNFICGLVTCWDINFPCNIIIFLPVKSVFFSPTHLPAGYTKCDLRAQGSLPSFRVSNERAWANPTPTPWGRDSEYMLHDNDIPNTSMTGLPGLLLSKCCHWERERDHL